MRDRERPADFIGHVIKGLKILNVWHDGLGVNVCKVECLRCGEITVVKYNALSQKVTSDGCSACYHKHLVYENKFWTMGELSNHLGISKNRLRMELSKCEQNIGKAVRSCLYDIDGYLMSPRDIGLLFGVSMSQFYTMLNNGHTPLEAATAQNYQIRRRKKKD